MTSSARSPTAGRTASVLLPSRVRRHGFVPTVSLQREDHGPGAGDVQHRLHPLVRNIGAEAGQARPRRVPLPAAHALLLRPGSAGTSPRFSGKEMFFFFFLGWGPNVLRLFLPEHFGIKTQRHFSEEDVRVR